MPFFITFAVKINGMPTIVVAWLYDKIWNCAGSIVFTIFRTSITREISNIVEDIKNIEGVGVCAFKSVGVAGILAGRISVESSVTGVLDAM